MRSLLIKTSILTFLVLSLGSGITLASASSEPGMFLYPVKQATQKAIDTFTNVTTVEVPIAVPSQTPAMLEPVVTQDNPVQGIHPETAEEPTGLESIPVDDSQGNQTTSTAPRMPVDRHEAVPEAGESLDTTGSPASPGIVDMLDRGMPSSTQNSNASTDNQNSNSSDNSQGNLRSDDSQNDNSQDSSPDNSQNSSQDDSTDNSNQNDNGQDRSADNSNQNDNSQDHSADNSNQNADSHDDSSNTNQNSSQDDSHHVDSSNDSQDNSSHDNSQDEAHNKD